MENYKNSNNNVELFVNHIDHRNDRIESRLLVNCLWSWFLALFVIRGASKQTLKLPPLFALDKFTCGMSKKYKSMTKSFRKRSKRGRGFNCWPMLMMIRRFVYSRHWDWHCYRLLLLWVCYFNLTFTIELVILLLYVVFFSLLLGWDATKSMYGSPKMATQYDMMFFLLS